MDKSTQQAESQPSPTEQIIVPDTLMKSITDKAMEYFPKNSRYEGAVVVGAELMYHKMQSHLSEAREDKEANIKRALEIVGERDRAIDEAQEYRKALERINEKWQILSKPAIVIAVRAVLDKYPSPENPIKNE